MNFLKAAFITCACSLFLADLLSSPQTWAAGPIIAAKGLVEASEPPEPPALRGRDLQKELEAEADRVHIVIEGLNSKSDTAKNIETLREQIRDQVQAAKNHSQRSADQSIGVMQFKIKAGLITVGSSVGIVGGLGVEAYHWDELFWNGGGRIYNTASAAASLTALALGVAVGTTFFTFKEKAIAPPLLVEFLRNPKVSKKSARLAQYFWNRLRAHGHKIPKGQEDAWLAMRLSDNAEEALLYYSKSDLIRETRRFKEAVLNTATLFTQEPESQKILQAFGQAIQIPGIALRLSPGSAALRKAADMLQATKLEFRKMAVLLDIERLRPVEEIVRMPIHQFLGLEDRQRQLMRLLNPQTSETRSFLTSITDADVPIGLLELLARADKEEISLKTTFAHKTQLQPSKQVPLGIHELSYSIEILEPGKPSEDIRGSFQFGSVHAHAVEVAASGDWKRAFTDALTQALGAAAECRGALIAKGESPLPPAVEPIAEVLDPTEATGPAVPERTSLKD